MVIYNRRQGEHIEFNGVKVYKFKGNGFFTIGIGLWAKIFVGNYVINKLNEQEIMAMIHHEQGHIAHKHIQKNLTGLLLMNLGVAIFLYLGSGLFIYAIIFIFLTASIPLFIFNMRIQELVADNYASRRISKSDLLSAIIKLSGNRGGIIHPNYITRAINLGVYVQDTK